MAKEYIKREAVFDHLAFCRMEDPETKVERVTGVVRTKDILAIPAADVVEMPPVKIGDKAFFVIGGRIYEAEICLVGWTQYRDFTHTEIRGELFPHHTVSASFEEFRKVVFLTREEAETALKKMGGGRRC